MRALVCLPSVNCMCVNYGTSSYHSYIVSVPRPQLQYVSWGNGIIDVSKPSTVTGRAKFEAAKGTEFGGAAVGGMAVTVHENS